ncbi:protein phosphatase 2A regulatory subunit [Trypanosoma rangeli SC58]|uniref:Protein phosphatase 2A regulatory subunit n=1 Tax=Trypanosoma rangeli SC58 TaxID=429131 RepID=A0A061J161_TRYRA|nr:protein phosphatase 2A regulatory subunit [Trypanosoma rangeli SC58]
MEVSMPKEEAFPPREGGPTSPSVSGSSTAARMTASLESSPHPLVADEAGAGDSPSMLQIPAIDALFLAQRTRESTELASDTAERSPTTPSSQSPVAVNPRRSLNPAFSLSPRAASGGGVLHLTSVTPSVTLSTDRDAPPTEYSYALGTVEGRRNFVKDVLCLARQMSTQKLVEELVPVLLLASNYEDTVCAIARVLPDVVKLVPALSEDTFVYFLGLIMNLCCAADHIAVHTVAVSLREIVRYVNDDIAANLLLPLLMSMLVSYWSSPRAVAASLLGVFAARPTLVEKSGMKVMQWFNCFIDLASDRCQFVQEMVVRSLHQWVAVAKAHGVNIVEMPLPLVHECTTKEKSDVVRHLHVAELVSLAKCIGKEATTKYLMLLFIEATRDASWRVRYTATFHLGRFSSYCYLHPDVLLDVFVALCRDETKEIRAAAVEQLGVFFCLNSPALLGKMCVVAASLAQDKEVVVRTSVANVFYVFLSPSVVGEYTPKQLQAFFAIVTDENYIVGQSVMRSLKNVAANFGKYLNPAGGDGARKVAEEEKLPVACNSHRGRRSGSAMSHSPSARADADVPPPSLTGPVDEEQRRRAALVLSGLIDQLHIVRDSKNWRMREALVVALRYFCVALTEEGFIPLLYVIRSLLRDPVCAVRESAIATLTVVATAYGPEWAALMAFDLFQWEFAFTVRTPYVWRVVAIQSLSGILPVVSGLSPMDLRRQELMQQWMRLVRCFSEDAVSNVRLAVAKSLLAHWDWYVVCGIHHNVIRQCADRLQRDSDVGVSRVAAELDVSRLAGDGNSF